MAGQLGGNPRFEHVSLSVGLLDSQHFFNTGKMQWFVLVRVVAAPCMDHREPILTFANTPYLNYIFVCAVVDI